MFELKSSKNKIFKESMNMTNLNVYEVYLKLFEELDYEPSLSQLAKTKNIVED
jgi:hypothetical protein